MTESQTMRDVAIESENDYDEAHAALDKPRDHAIVFVTNGEKETIPVTGDGELWGNIIKDIGLGNVPHGFEYAQLRKGRKVLADSRNVKRRKRGKTNKQ